MDMTERIVGCRPVPMKANRDARGCLYEIFRQEWTGSFPTVQWNACASQAGVLRGVHVHADYAEFYTLPQGRVFLVLRDIRRASPTFGRVQAVEWSAADGVAFPVPAGVAHAVYFIDDSVLVFGLSDYWRAERDILGCHYRQLGADIAWPADAAQLSARDQGSGMLQDMIAQYEAMAGQLGVACAAGASTRG